MLYEVIDELGTPLPFVPSKKYLPYELDGNISGTNVEISCTK